MHNQEVERAKQPASGEIHGLRTPRESFSKKILNFWASVDILGHLGYFWPIYQHPAHYGTVSPMSMFSINQPLFLQNTKPLYPNPKYLFGIGIWNWAAKNYRFSHRVSVVHGLKQTVAQKVKFSKEIFLR